MGMAGDGNSISGTHGACSAIGHVRDHNEDSFLSAPEVGLWVIADGMGGHAAGEVASRIACERINRAVRDGKDLTEAIAEAAQGLAAALVAGEGSSGMGTTVVACRLSGHRYDIAWLGDSRAYLWHDNRLRQLTHDHSYVQELLDQYAITAEEAESHPEKSTLSRCLGGGNSSPPQTDHISNSFFADELLILCTDGVTGELTFEQMEHAIRARVENAASAQEISEALVALALENGGNDNATVVVIEAPVDAPQRIRQTAPRKSITSPAPALNNSVKRKRRRLLALAAALLIVLALLLYALWPRPYPENGDAVAGLTHSTDFSDPMIPMASPAGANWPLHQETNP